jgi:hypothetical protein
MVGRAIRGARGDAAGIEEITNAESHKGRFGLVRYARIIDERVLVDFQVVSNW